MGVVTVSSSVSRSPLGLTTRLRSRHPTVQKVHFLAFKSDNSKSSCFVTTKDSLKIPTESTVKKSQNTLKRTKKKPKKVKAVATEEASPSTSDLDYDTLAATLENIYKLSPDILSDSEDTDVITTRSPRLRKAKTNDCEKIMKERGIIVRNKKKRARLSLDKRMALKKDVKRVVGGEDVDRLLRDYSASTDLASLDWKKMKIPAVLSSSEHTWLFKLMQPMKSILEVKENLHVELDRELSDGEVAAAINMNTSEMRKQIQIGRAARNKLIKHNLRLVLFVINKYYQDWQVRRTMVPLKVKLLVGVLTLHFCDAGFLVASRVALNVGVTKVVFTVYRNVIALILLAPFAFFLEKKDRPPLTLSVLVKIFLLALIGITANQGFYILGMFYLPPTFASAIQNSLPAVTFSIAAMLRMEHVSMTKAHGLAKVIGIIVTIGGATIITLYKGPPLLNHQPPSNHQSVSLSSVSTLASQTHDWTLGCLYIIGNTLAWSAWLILQVPLLKEYPARLSLTTFTCFFGLLQFLAIAAFVERDVEHWKVQSGGGIFTVLYSGLVGTGIGFSLQLWLIDRGGPLFVAVFQPIQTAAVAIMAFLILGDKLYSGGVIGATLIVVGLYFVLWGKSKEKKEESQEEEDLTRHLLDGKHKDKENLLPTSDQP